MKNPMNPSFAVLFVDDEEKARKMFSRLVSPHFPVLTAADVKEAMTLLEQEHETIGVLITDQRMPGLLGVDLLRHTRQHYPKIIRLLTTAYSDLEDAISAVNTGEIFRYINKPWNVDELLIDIRLAMNFFLLEQDRQRLIQEKLSVSDRQFKIELLKNLIAMAGAQQQFRQPLGAIQSFLEQFAAAQAWVAENTATQSHHYWGHEVAKAEKLMTFATGLNAWCSKAAGFIVEGEGAGNVNLADVVQQLKSNTGLALDAAGADRLIPAYINAEGATVMLAVLANSLQSTDDNAANRIELVTSRQDNAVQWLMRAASPESTLAQGFVATGDVAYDQKLANLIGLFLLANHVGGTVALEFDGDALAQIALTLPESQGEPASNTQGDEWLEDLFVLYS